MPDDVGELAAGREGPDIQLTDGVSQTVPLVGRAVSVTGVRGLRHPDAQVPHGNHPGNQLQRDRAAFALGDGPHGVSLPDALRDAVIEWFLFAGPELHRIAARVRVRPGDLDRKSTRLNSSHLGIS